MLKPAALDAIQGSVCGRRIHSTSQRSCLLPGRHRRCPLEAVPWYEGLVNTTL